MECITDSLLCRLLTLLIGIVFQNELKEKDLAIRKFEQETDSLSFRNNQLSMRVNVLQQELDEAHARNKKHKVSRELLDVFVNAQESSNCWYVEYPNMKFVELLLWHGLVSRCATQRILSESRARNTEGFGRKGIQYKNTLGCMAGFTLIHVCVAAAGLLVVLQ